MKQFKNAAKKAFRAGSAALMAAAVFCQKLYASSNTYAENAAKWVLDGLFWLVVVLVIGGAAFAAVKRNLSGALITVLVGAVVLVIIKNPGILETLGNQLKSIIGI